MKSTTDALELTQALHNLYAATDWLTTLRRGVVRAQQNEREAEAAVKLAREAVDRIRRRRDHPPSVR